MEVSGLKHASVVVDGVGPEQEDLRKLWDLDLWQIGHDSADCTDYPAIYPRLDFVNVAGGSILATGA